MNVNERAFFLLTFLETKICGKCHKLCLRLEWKNGKPMNEKRETSILTLLKFLL